MSTVQDTDLLLVNRGGQSYYVKVEDMSTVLDTDLLLINRGGQSFKVEAQDLPGGETSAPVIASAVLSESDPTGDRFTDQTFDISVLMNPEGVPISNKALKAYVRGEITVYGQTSPVTNVNGNVLTFQDDKDLDDQLFKPGDAVTGYNPPTTTQFNFTGCTPYAGTYNPNLAFDGNYGSGWGYGYSFIQQELLPNFDIQVLSPETDWIFHLWCYQPGAASPVLINGVDVTDQVVGINSPDDVVACTLPYTGIVSSLTLPSPGAANWWGLQAVEIVGQGVLLGPTPADGAERIYTWAQGATAGATDQPWGGVEVVSVDAPNTQMTLSGGSWNIGNTVTNTVSHPVYMTPESSAIVSSQIIGNNGDPTAPTATSNTENHDFGPWLFSQGVTAITGFRLEGPYDNPNYTYTALLYNIRVDGSPLYGVYREVRNVIGQPYYNTTFSFANYFSTNSVDTTQIGGDTTASNQVYSCEFDPIALTSSFVTSYYSYGVSPHPASFKAFIMDQNGNWVSLFGENESQQLTFIDDTDLAEFTSGMSISQNAPITPVTSEITRVDTLKPSKGISTGTPYDPDYTWIKAFNGELGVPGANGTNQTWNDYTLTLSEPITGTTIQVNISTNTVPYQWGFNDTEASASNTTFTVTDGNQYLFTLTGVTTLTQLSIGSYAQLTYVVVDGAMLVDGSSQLTFQNNTQLNNLQSGDLVSIPSGANGEILSTDIDNTRVIVDGGPWDSYNLSETWSSLGTGTIDSSYGAAAWTAIFGATEGTDYPSGITAAAGQYLELDFGSTFANATTLDIIGYASLDGVTYPGANENLEINGTVIAADAWIGGGGVTGQGKASFQLSNGLSTLKWGYNAGSQGLGHIYLENIFVDGQRLCDTGVTPPNPDVVGQIVTSFEIDGIGKCLSVDGLNMGIAARNYTDGATITGTSSTPTEPYAKTWEACFTDPSSWGDWKMPAFGSGAGWNNYTITFEAPITGSTIQLVLVNQGVSGYWGFNEQEVNGTTLITTPEFWTHDNINGYLTTLIGVTELTQLGVSNSNGVLCVIVDGEFVMNQTSSPRFAIGSSVVGSSKIQSETTMYCDIDATGLVEDLSDEDPGWELQNVQDTIQDIRFGATMATGNPPDEELPAGTTLTVEVKAYNDTGSSERTTNTITPGE